MRHERYRMHDLSGDKVDQIMDFNVASGRARSRSIIELGVFVIVLLGYIVALAISR